MTTVFSIFIFLLCLIAHYTSIVIWSRKETVLRIYAFMLFFAAVPSLVFGATESLGWHKDIRWAWRINEDSLVIGHKILYGESIYIYVDPLDGTEPRSLVLPWDAMVAQGLSDAMARAHRNGEKGVIMRWQFGLDTGYVPPMFWSVPPADTPPPKDPVPSAPIMEW